MTKERIPIGKTIRCQKDVMDVIIEMTGGDLNATLILIRIFLKTPEIDPYDNLKGLGPIHTLDSLNIWDEKIYKLWSDVCSKNDIRMVAVLRAYQLGGLAGVTKDALNYAINHKKDIDLNEVMRAVKEQLPNFNTEVLA